MDMSEAIQEAYAYADPSVTIWETFEFTHASWADSIRLVDSDAALLTALGTFMPVTLSAAMPETESSVRGQMQITIDFLPAEYKKLIWEASHTALPVYVYYRQYTEDAADAEPEAELPVPLTVSGFEFTDKSTIVTALYPDLVNLILGRRTMTATELPGART
jgi:hypothetical protein